MTREERDLTASLSPGVITSPPTTHAEVNKHGYLGEVYGLPRHLFRDTIDGGRARASW
jgi:hypothetical protein